MTSIRARLALAPPALWVALTYVAGVVLRTFYTLRVHPPEAFVWSDMSMYVARAQYLARPHEPLMPWDVTHPLGYPALLAFIFQHGGTLAAAAKMQIVVSSLVPLAVGLLGTAAFGRKTGMLGVVFASIYFPFIEFGAYFLSEIHLILFLTLAFAGFLGARWARRPVPALAMAVAGGVALSVAASFKSVALVAAVAFFAVDAVGIVLAGSAREPQGSLRRLGGWLARAAAVVVGATPLLAFHARVCTVANRGHFCLTQSKASSDFLLGHYGRIADIAWASDEGHGFQFGSPSAYLRHYDYTAHVPFLITDNAANAAEAWHWIFAHPGDAIVLSLDHVYDAFFGPAMWPSFNHASWPLAHLAQYAFVVLLFFPTLFAVASVARQGLRALLVSRTCLLLAPIAALTFTVAMATGEVRYRIPFDVFFIAIVSAYVVGDLARLDGQSMTGAPLPLVGVGAAAGREPAGRSNAAG